MNLFVLYYIGVILEKIIKKTKESGAFIMAFGMKDVLNGAKSVAGSNLVQGVLNNYSEMTTEDMQKEYGMYLMDGEEITADLKAHEVQYVSHKLEFPKKYNVQPLYKLLQELAYNNCLRINGLD